MVLSLLLCPTLPAVTFTVTTAADSGSGRGLSRGGLFQPVPSSFRSRATGHHLQNRPQTGPKVERKNHPLTRPTTLC